MEFPDSTDGEKGGVVNVLEVKITHGAVLRWGELFVGNFLVDVNSHVFLGETTGLELGNGDQVGDSLFVHTFKSG